MKNVPRHGCKKKDSSYRSEEESFTCPLEGNQIQSWNPTKGSAVAKSCTCSAHTWPSEKGELMTWGTKSNCASLEALCFVWSSLCCFLIHPLLGFPSCNSSLIDCSTLAFSTKNMAKLTCDLLPWDSCICDATRCSRPPLSSENVKWTWAQRQASFIINDK
jgi:hypothetical protein